MSEKTLTRPKMEKPLPSHEISKRFKTPLGDYGQPKERVVETVKRLFAPCPNLSHRSKSIHNDSTITQPQNLAAKENCKQLTLHSQIKHKRQETQRIFLREMIKEKTPQLPQR